MSADTLLTITGWALITIGVAATVLLAVFRKRPTVRELLTLPDPTPAVQDAIDDGDDFDAHVDQALAIANSDDTPELLIFCQECRGPFAATTLRDLVTHLRTLHAPGSDWPLWESELRSDR